jgi:hypothetical protein
MAAVAPFLLGAAEVAATSTAAAIPATAGLFGAGGAITAAGAFSAVSTGLGIFSALQSGFQQDNAFEAQRIEAEVQGRQAQIAGNDEQIRIKDSLRRELAAQAARWGDSGAAGPVTQQTAFQATSDASNELSNSRFNTYAARRRLQWQATQYKKSKGGLFGTALQIAEPVNNLALNYSLRAG